MVESIKQTDTQIFWLEKKDTYIKIKLWDDEKSQKILNLRKVLETINAYIFKHLLKGKEISLTIAKYMKEHASADNTYSIQLKNQLVYLPSPSNQYSDSLKSSLSLLSQIQQSLSNSFRDLSQRIENIVNTQLATNLIDFEKNASEANSLWTAAISEINTLQAKSEKAYKEYLSTFHSQETEISKKGYVTSCLWLSEAKFMNSVENLIRQYKSCSVLTKGSWDMLINFENLRIDTLKNSIMDFIKLHNEIFETKADSAWNILQEYNSGVHDLVGLIRSENLQGENEEFDGFDKIFEWKLPDAPRANLVVKEALIDRETAVFKVWKNSYAVLTSDSFLHVFNEDPKVKFEPPVNSCYVHGASIIENEELYFEIIEAKQIGIFSKLAAPKRSVFKLNTLDEFLDWVRSINQLV